MFRKSVPDKKSSMNGVYMHSILLTMHLHATDLPPLATGLALPYLHSFLTAAPHGPLHAARPHPVHYVPRQTERHALWGRQELPLLKRHPQVDLHHPCRPQIQQDIPKVTVS